MQNEQEFEALFFASEKARVNGDLRTAISGYKELLQYRVAVINREEYTDFTNYDAIIIERLGDLSWLFGFTKVADQLFSSLQNLGRESGNHYLQVYLGIKRASLAVDKGALEEAFSLLQDLNAYFGDIHNIPFHNLDAWEEHCHFPVSNEEQNAILKTRLYFVLGGILMRLGQFEESIRSFRQGLKTVQGKTYKMVEAVRIPLSLGVCRALLEKGDIHKANTKINSILPDVEKSISSGNYINWLELSAKYKMLTGQFGDAKKYFEEIIDLCHTHNLINAQIIALCNLSNINIFLNKISYAKELLSQAKTLAVQVANKKAIRKIQILSQIALKRSTSIIPGVSIMPSYTHSSPQKSTTSMYSYEAEEKPASDIEQTDFYLSFFEDKAIIFQQLLGNFTFEQAEEYLQHIIQIFQHTDSTLIKSRLQFFRFLMMYYKESKTFDQQEILKLQSYFKGQNLLPELWDLQRFMGWIDSSKESFDQDLKQKNYALLQRMTQSLNPTDQSIFLLNKWTTEEENLAGKTNHLLNLSRKKEQAGFILKFIRNWQLRSTLDNLLEELESYKSFVAGKLFNKQNNWIQTEKQNWIKRMLFQPRDRLEIFFLILPDRALIVYRGYLFFKYQIIAINRINVREYVQLIHTSYSSFNKTRGAGSVIDQKTSSKEITAVLTKIAEAFNLPKMLSLLPSRIKRLTFIPDDALHGLPFALIPYEERFLIEHFAISVHCKRSPPPSWFFHKKRVKSALLVGISYEDIQEDELPGVSKEIDAIKRLLDTGGFSVKKLDEKNASKTNILKNAVGKKLLHIACHGVFNPENPDLSGLILSDNGRLTLKDIWSNPQFSEVKHVSLSSCWAADNFILPNKWILSLPETLLRSGVESVLACFWEVSDQVSVKFMEKFYANLKVYPRDVALQKTQLMAIQNTLEVEETDTHNPFYWAGFNIFGRTDKF